MTNFIYFDFCLFFCFSFLEHQIKAKIMNICVGRYISGSYWKFLVNHKEKHFVIIWFHCFSKYSPWNSMHFSFYWTNRKKNCEVTRKSDSQRYSLWLQVLKTANHPVCFLLLATTRNQVYNNWMLLTMYILWLSGLCTMMYCSDGIVFCFWVVT